MEFVSSRRPDPRFPITTSCVSCWWEDEAESSRTADSAGASSRKQHAVVNRLHRRKTWFYAAHVSPLRQRITSSTSCLPGRGRPGDILRTGLRQEGKHDGPVACC